MRKSLLIAAAFALPFAATPALADDHEGDKPELANKDWYNIVYIDFHDGKVAEAKSLIEAFMKVDAALGEEGPIAFAMNSGEWDMMVAFKMQEGIGSMGWKDNPRQAKWNAELARQLGGEDKAAEHWAKYLATVKRSSSDIAHIDLDWGK